MLLPHVGVKGPIAKHSGHLVAGLRALGCTVVTEPWGRHRDVESPTEKVVGRLRDIARVRRAARAQPFDVIVVKTSHDWATLLRDLPLVLALGRRAPVVLQLHGSEPERLLRPGNRAFKYTTALLSRLVDGVMVLSTEEQRQWQRFYPRGRFFVVTNPFVPGEEWAADGAAGRCREETRHVPAVLFVGRLMRPKGVFELVEAMASVVRDTPCRLVMVGEGPDEKALRDRVTALALEDQITFTGYLRGNDLVEAYRGADVFVLPSWSEGFPTVLAEAMQAGLPIVTTRIRGAADHLTEGTHGLLVPPRDPAALASALTRLLRDAGRRAAMSTANREKVRSFAPEVVARHYLDVLRAVTAGERRWNEIPRRPGQGSSSEP